MKIRALGALLGAAALALSMAAVSLAATSHASPSKVEADTTTLTWSGQGLPLDSKCGDKADPGAGGFQNGATADSYLLWVFNDDGGSVTGNVTLTIDGVTYGNAYQNHMIVTPGLDPTAIASAAANFVVATTGSGDWVLTISHGCVATQESTPPSDAPSASPVQPPTDTESTSGSAPAQLPLLLVALGVLAASIVILAPKRR